MIEWMYVGLGRFWDIRQDRIYLIFYGISRRTKTKQKRGTLIGRAGCDLYNMANSTLHHKISKFPSPEFSNEEVLWYVLLPRDSVGFDTSAPPGPSGLMGL